MCILGSDIELTEEFSIIQYFKAYLNECTELF